ncbi:MAG: hypothetical protein DYH20_07880 [Gammaproteobacteria bacterium PRO9]|nr:hypothetical protein [Gammaproteobacteria bacterium PRO9]
MAADHGLSADDLIGAGNRIGRESWSPASRESAGDHSGPIQRADGTSRPTGDLKMMGASGLYQAIWSD